MTKRALGFTIVELVVVLMLLGILSATAMSRFVGANAFAPGAISTAVSAQSHYAALTAQTSTNIISLTLTLNAGQWRVDVVNGGLNLRSTTLDEGGVAVTVANNGNTYAVDAANGLAINFGDDGEMISATIGATALTVDAGTQLTMTGDSARVLCFYPTGYVSDQVC